jgi:hypothetical protein
MTKHDAIVVNRNLRKIGSSLERALRSNRIEAIETLESLRQMGHTIRTSDVSTDTIDQWLKDVQYALFTPQYAKLSQKGI